MTECILFPFCTCSRSVSVLYPFRSCFHSHSVSVPFPFAFAFPIRFLLISTVYCMQWWLQCAIPVFKICQTWSLLCTRITVCLEHHTPTKCHWQQGSFKNIHNWGHNCDSKENHTGYISHPWSFLFLWHNLCEAKKKNIRNLFSP